MGDAALIIAYGAGFIGLLSAAMVYYVHQTANELERRWHHSNERMQNAVRAFQAVESNLSEIKEKLALKASYQQTEKRLSEATSRLMVKEKHHASLRSKGAVTESRTA
ncbi:MAG TPA: hypothetical protein VI874_04270 [Candidatus Norongarragalinales archaeon]|nr:hypothetical protein [Candidatus Norongarragalinales archaeon]